jgi:hypothetical protein
MPTKRTHPSGRDVDRLDFTGTPEAKAIARRLRAHARRPDMQTHMRRWQGDDGVELIAEWRRADRTRNKAGWALMFFSDKTDLYSPGTSKTLRVAFRSLARRMEGRPIVHAPREYGWSSAPTVPVEHLGRARAVRRAVTDAPADPHRIPIHRPGRPDHLRDLIAKWHRTA